MKVRYKIFILGIVGLFLVSCEPETKTEIKTDTISTNTVVTKPHVLPPNFNSDSAYAYVKTQADMGPRVPGSNAHKKCVSFMENFLKACGAEVKVQGGNATSFDNKSWRIDNVTASFNVNAKNRILLCTHYDSRPFCEHAIKPEDRTKPCPGVNDGASGVGVLMEVARAIKSNSLSVGVDIVMFDLEDYGDNGGNPDTWCLGSQDWAKNAHRPCKYGILLDMVGAKNATFPKEGISKFYANDILAKVWTTAQNLGYGNYFIDPEYGKMTDDHTYINEIAQIPCIDILHYDITAGSFFEHHHKPTDDLSTIDKNTLKAVGQTLLELIYNEE